MPQLVGVTMKPGRSTVTVEARMLVGTPRTSSGSDVVVAVRPPSGRSCSRTLTTVLPRLTSPTCAGTAIDRPAGSPGACATVRNVWPASVTGPDPDPVATVAEPTLLEAGQFEAAASASEHIVRPGSARLPTRPAGSENDAWSISRSRSGRLNVSV